MELLSSDAVLQSDIVANSVMNRERGLDGVNSYSRELRLDILAWLIERALTRGTAFWYDACYGEGTAVMQALGEIRRLKLQDSASAVGADLIGAIKSAPTAEIRVGDVATFDPGMPADLITCVHGVHYVADKLAFIAHCYSLLSSNGVFVCNIDLANLLVDQHPVTKWSELAKCVPRLKNCATLSKHVLRIEKKEESRLSFGMRFVGATISAKPNYSGITVINSWYEHI